MKSTIVLIGCLVISTALMASTNSADSAALPIQQTLSAAATPNKSADEFGAAKRTAKKRVGKSMKGGKGHLGHH